ncbi:glycoprotein precursor [Emaravirus cercidis]|uniref:Glycoprotein n=1 Tax=Emaravirus cercidis TaxID=1980432 RepID=G3G863_9VIRU|nr:glycoprotein precursor [Emaravirus cercidis]AEO95761.1 glycoprotein precursor [Emaravirus cercidis]
MKCLMNMIAAIAIIGALLASYRFGMAATKKTCQCLPKIVKISGKYLLCADDCVIKPVTDKAFNNSCSHMSEITIIECMGKRIMASRPDSTNHDSYSWLIFISKLLKFATCLAVWLFVSLNKYPILLSASIMHRFICRFAKGATKKCNQCNGQYLLSHIDCPVPSFKLRTDLNLVYYMVIVVVLLITAVKAEDNNVYNYYYHGHATEIQLLDKEHYSQDFKANGLHYNFYVENSHLVYNYVEYSNITRPVAHTFGDMTWSCRGIDGCKEEFQGKFNKQTEFAIKKVNDGFSCGFTTATICGLCTSNHIQVGVRVKVISVKPYIDIRVRKGNKTSLIVIREFNKFYQDPYYVKPINPTSIENVDYLVSGVDVYTGQFCNQPNTDCFGPNYIKDGSHVKLHTPKVIDPLTHDREVILEYCDYPYHADLHDLKKTAMVNHNGVIISPHDFGLISIGIPHQGELYGNFCKDEVPIHKIGIEGCYDCESGFTIEVFYHLNEVCGTINCDVGGMIQSYFADQESNSIKFHSFFDKESVIINCNGYRHSYKLLKSTDSTVYSKMNYLDHSPYGSGVDWQSMISLISWDYKKSILVILMVIVSCYMIYRTIKNIMSHMNTIRRYNEVGRQKKTDEPKYNSVLVEVEIGDAD